MYYRAIIEDNNNPNKNGKVRVRVFGIHTPSNENSSEDFNYIRTSDLPWAEVMGSLENGLNSGIGLSKIPKNGTMVWIIFDHDDINYPVVVGTITGVNTVDSTGLYASGGGFCDPKEVYPIVSRLNEPDINRLARVEKLDQTIHQAIINAKDTVTKTDTVSGANVSQTEPDSTNNLSKYTDIQVLETASGHVVELDDTLNNERVRVYHKSGSYIEIQPDGSFVQKSVGAENHFINAGDVQEHIQGYVKTYLEKNLEEIVSGGIKQHVELDKFNHISGYFKIQADGNLEIINDVKITGNLQVTTAISAGSNISSKGEVADSQGNLSSLRDAYDNHYAIGNLGIPTGLPIITDPKVRWGDFTWSNTPLGFL